MYIIYRYKKKRLISSIIKIYNFFFDIKSDFILYSKNLKFTSQKRIGKKNIKNKKLAHANFKETPFFISHIFKQQKNPLKKIEQKSILNK